MIKINLSRPRYYPLIVQRAPQQDRAWKHRVQLWRVIAGTKVPAPKLHRLGYKASPFRWAPLCSLGQRGGPYGRQVAYAADLPPPYRECPDCETIYQETHHDG